MQFTLRVDPLWVSSVSSVGDSSTQPELDPSWLPHTPLWALSLGSPPFPFREWFVGSYLRLPLESPQFNGLRTLGEARKGPGEIVKRIHLGAVYVELYRASPSLQIAQSQEDPVPPAVSQLQVVENHQMNLPIILQVTEDGWNQAQINEWWEKGNGGDSVLNSLQSQGWVRGKNISKSEL